MLGKFPKGSPSAAGIGEDYAATLNVVVNQLRDMDQEDVSWEKGTEGVGVLVADSMMFQRAEPAFSAGIAAAANDPTRATQQEVLQLSGFFGMTLPLLKRGIPIRPVQLENVLRCPGYLQRYKVLLLSYEFMKPSGPAIHQVLAEWIGNGGTLIYVGADTDPFHQVREWWNRPPSQDTAACEDLFARLRLGRTPKEGEYRFGKGLVVVERKHPAWLGRSAEGAARLARLVRRGVEAAGNDYVERNRLQLRRGPYVVAAVLDESVGKEPLRLHGPVVDLLDARLPIRDEITIQPGCQALLLDLGRVTARAPVMLASSGRVESWSAAATGVRYTTTSPEGIQVVSRIRLPSAPTAVAVADKRCAEWSWHAASNTLFLRHPGSAKPIEVGITWRPTAR
jgi:hypothetical protein